MFDSTKVILGLVIFLILATFPFWFSLANETYGYKPELTLPENEENCVEVVEYMRSFHMDLLSQWRDSVVRDANRVYVSSSGRRYPMSLSGTCLGCHTKRAEFCDRCHTYVDVDPYCWDCHVDAETGEGK